MRQLEIEKELTPSPPPLPNNKQEWLGLGLIMLVGTALRFYRIDAVGFWLDETAQYFFALERLDRLVFAAPIDNPPLMYYITKLQMLFFPWKSEAAYRLPSLVFGLGTILACYGLAKTWLGQKVAYLSAILAAIAPILVNYSQENRAYALFVLLSTFSAYFLFRAIVYNQWVMWFGFTLCTILSLYTHHNTLFTLGAEGIFSAIYLVSDTIRQLFTKQGWAKIWQTQGYRLIYGLGSICLILAAYIPGIAFLLSFLKSYNLGAGANQPAFPFTLEVISIIFADLGLGTGNNIAQLLLPFLAIIGFGWTVWKNKAAALLALLWLILPFLVLSISNGGAAILRASRYLIFLTPIYLIMVAAGTIALSEGLFWLLKKTKNPLLTKLQWGIIGLLTLGLSGLALIGLLNYYENPKTMDMDLRGAFNFVQSDLKSGDVVLEFTGGAHLSGVPIWFTFYNSYYMRNIPPNTPIVQFAPDMATAALTNALQSKGRVWAIVTHGANTQDVLNLTNPQSKAACFTKICAIQLFSPSGTSKMVQLEQFLEQYAPINPTLSQQSLAILKGIKA